MSKLRFVLIIACLFLTSCSSQKKDYAAVQEVQNVATQIIGVTSDYDTKIKNCDNAINALTAFIQKNPDGEWHDTATAALAIWQAKKDEFGKQSKTLADSNTEEAKAQAKKTDVDDVQRIQDASLESVGNTPDYDVKMKSCDDAINALNSFIQKYPTDEMSTTYKTALASWQTKRTGFARDVKALKDKLGVQMWTYAEELAHGKHGASHIETMSVADSSTQKDGSDYVIKKNYAVRMVGSIIGHSIFKLNVKVTGHVAMASKQVSYDSPGTVVE
jgi:hypothetical protein